MFGYIDFRNDDYFMGSSYIEDIFGPSYNEVNYPSIPSPFLYFILLPG